MFNARHALPHQPGVFETYAWIVINWMTLISLAIFFALILFRYFGDKKNKRDDSRRAAIVLKIINHLLGRANSPLKEIKNKKDLNLLVDAVPEILQKIDQKSRQDFFKLLTQVGFYDWIKRSLDGSKKNLRLRAINVLSDLPSDDYLKNRLATLLKSRDHATKYAALEALANTKDLEFFPAILNSFRNKNNFSYPARNAAFHKFGTQISDQLAALVKSKTTPLHVKVSALMALSQTDEVKNIVESAIVASCDKNNDFRAFAFRSLAKSKKEISLEIIERGHRDSYWRVRLYSANCAANSKILPTEILVTLLDDVDPIVGLQAARVLFSANKVSRQLLETIAKKPSRVGKRAKMILLENGGRRGIS